MKKIALLIICIAMTCGAYAQDGKFSWGVKASLNLSNIVGSGSDGTNIKVGYQAGLVGEYRFTKLFAIAPELVFSAQGAHADGDIDGVIIKAAANINYINLPIMAKFYVTKDLSIDFGPQIGYAVFFHTAGVKVPTDNYNAFDFSLGIGATYNFNKLFVDARYNLGLTDIVKHSDSNKNSNIQIGLGYKF
ncbi:MAG: porin family protein [Muribaculaceae bacterium]